MKLNHEQIVEALENCKFEEYCKKCPYSGRCWDLNEDAVALIKELTEINSNLDDSIACLKIEREIESNRLKVEALEYILLRLALHFGTYTGDAEIKVFDVFKLLDQIKEDVLEGNQ